MPSKYYLCPDCGRFGVYLKWLPNQEDNYRCRYRDCGFYFFTVQPADDDLKRMNRFLDSNELQELP